MKNNIMLMAFLFMILPSYGQEMTIDKILLIKEEKVSIYEPDILSGRQLYLKMNYGSSVILNSLEVKKLDGAKVAGVDIVYSDHPQGEQYSDLMRSRIKNLKKINPALFDHTDIEWRFIRQTNCTDRSSAEKLFHGIVITYRPKQTSAEVVKEISYMKDILSEKSKTPDISEYSGFIEPELLSESRIAAITTKRVTSEGVIVTDSVSFEEGVTYAKFEDSAVIATLKRNNWKNMVVTADVTGSMSPYTTQFLIWLRLNTMDSNVKLFVFFNDGNTTPDNRKVIGHTGGIYHTRSSKYEDVEKLAYTTMRNGSGGDAPENDIESLEKAIALCPECDNVILIADNWAPIKDITLMPHVKKPIKIILCGADYGINTQYLDLARATGGSVHTMEADLTELMKLNEGEKVTIGKQIFKIENGRFVLVSKLKK